MEGEGILSNYSIPFVSLATKASELVGYFIMYTLLY